MKRGDIVVVSASGEYGEPRPPLLYSLIYENHISINDTDIHK